MNDNPASEGPQTARWRDWSAERTQRLLALPWSQRLEKMRLPAFANLMKVHQAQLWTSIERSGPASDVAHLTPGAVTDLPPKEQQRLADQAVQQLRALPVPKASPPTTPRRRYRHPDPIEPPTQAVAFSVADLSSARHGLGLLALTSLWAAAILVVGIIVVDAVTSGSL